MTKTILNYALFAALASTSSLVSAGITSSTTVNFSGSSQGTGNASGTTNSNAAAYFGEANLAAGSGVSTCGTGSASVGSNGCFLQNGIVVGSVSDPTNTATHFHIDTDTVNGGKAATLQADSNGLYIRASDSSAFSLTSLVLDMTIQQIANGDNTTLGLNPAYGSGAFVDDTGVIQPTGSYYTDTSGSTPVVLPQGQTDPNYNGYYTYLSSVTPTTAEGWEILGFSNAQNLNLATGSYTDLVAQQFVSQGFDGTLTLNSSFDNVKGVWIYYNGYQETPTNGIVYSGQIDRIVVNAAASAVPVPGAVWLFAGGLASLLSLGNRKNRLVS